VTTVDEAARAARAAAAVEGDAPVRVLPRVGPGGAVVHVLGRAYDPRRDVVEPVRDVALRVDLEALGVPGCRRARVITPDAPPVEVPIEGSWLRIAAAGLWTLVYLEAPV
jgi:hypothetical protein